MHTHEPILATPSLLKTHLTNMLQKAVNGRRRRRTRARTSLCCLYDPAAAHCA